MIFFFFLHYPRNVHFPRELVRGPFIFETTIYTLMTTSVSLWEITMREKYYLSSFTSVSSNVLLPCFVEEHTNVRWFLYSIHFDYISMLGVMNSSKTVYILVICLVTPDRRVPGFWSKVLQTVPKYWIDHRFRLLYVFSLCLNYV